MEWLPQNSCIYWPSSALRPLLSCQRADWRLLQYLAKNQNKRMKMREMSSVLNWLSKVSSFTNITNQLLRCESIFSEGQIYSSTHWCDIKYQWTGVWIAVHHTAVHHILSTLAWRWHLPSEAWAWIFFVCLLLVCACVDETNGSFHKNMNSFLLQIKVLLRQVKEHTLNQTHSPLCLNWIKTWSKLEQDWTHFVLWHWSICDIIRSWVINSS